MHPGLGTGGLTLPGVWARPDPDAPLLSGPAVEPLTYGQAWDSAARMAAALADLGVGAGDRVALQVEKSPLAIVVYLACVHLGAVLVPMNPAYTDDEVAGLVDDAEPAVMIRDPGRLGPAAGPGGRHAPVLVSAGPGPGGLEARAAAAGTPPPARVPDPEDLVAILYTSGTTGRPKGAMLSHRALASNAVALHRAWGFRPGDVLLHALPLFHTHGLFVALNTVLVNGSPLVFLPRFETDAVLEGLASATVFMGVPTFYTRLLADSRLDAGRCSGMRLFTCGSAPLLASTHAEFLGRTGHAIVERYGLTETNILTSNPLDRPRAGTVGMPLDGVDLRVAGPEGTPVAAGEVGEVEVRGPGLASGYWGRPEAWAAEHRPGGWFRTGDLAQWDPDGYLVLVGRSKDLIISGGLNVYPKEVEGVIDGIAGVAESAVVGLPDPDFGEKVVAVVVALPGASLDPDGVRAACRGHLAPFKVPKEVVLAEALPRNAMGKVEKARLRAELPAG